MVRVKVQELEQGAATYNTRHDPRVVLAVDHHFHLPLEIEDIRYEAHSSGKTYTTITSPSRTLSLTRALEVHKVGWDQWRKQVMKLCEKVEMQL
jgi:hypothetical protein